MNSHSNQCTNLRPISTNRQGALGARFALVGSALALVVGLATMTTSGATTTLSPTLAKAVNAYAAYVETNVAGLVASSQRLCTAINAGNLAAAQQAYPKARVFYERIEPATAKWATLDTEIDGRWEDPVTVRSQLMGFHRIEQTLFASHTVTGTATYCAGLVHHASQLLSYVKKTSYGPLLIVSGATDLMNEAATSKVTGVEELYSKTTLNVLQANVTGAHEVVTLFTPYLKTKNPSLLATLNERYASTVKVVDSFKSSPGYDGTGFVTYASVATASRRALAQVLNAYAESISQLSTTLS